ncbi:hypothetical protein PUN28_017298 [Cardiocondyla obscurior]|uniref:Uncharacterized protein n=1 Tax=Cardiocondyla obscurior TaxID=286306 RepID=A0AAW2EL53_9HYME
MPHDPAPRRAHSTSRARAHCVEDRGDARGHAVVVGDTAREMTRETRRAIEPTRLNRLTLDRHATTGSPGPSRTLRLPPCPCTPQAKPAERERTRLSIHPRHPRETCTNKNITRD